MPFAHVRRFGLELVAVAGEPVPTRPKPVMTSSATKSDATLAARPRARPQVSSGAGNTPPAPITGSQKNPRPLGRGPGGCVSARSSRRPTRPGPRRGRGFRGQLVVVDTGERGARRVHAVIRRSRRTTIVRSGWPTSCRACAPSSSRCRRVGAAAREEHAAVGDRRERLTRSASPTPGGSRGHRRWSGRRAVSARRPPPRCASSEPDVREPQTRRGVEVSPAGVVPDVRPSPRTSTSSPSRSPAPCPRTGARGRHAADATAGVPRGMWPDVARPVPAQSVSYARFGRSHRSASPMLSPRRRA